MQVNGCLGGRGGGVPMAVAPAGMGQVRRAPCRWYCLSHCTVQPSTGIGAVLRHGRSAIDRLFCFFDILVVVCSTVHEQVDGQPILTTYHASLVQCEIVYAKRDPKFATRCIQYVICLCCYCRLMLVSGVTTWCMFCGTLWCTLPAPSTTIVWHLAIFTWIWLPWIPKNVCRGHRAASATSTR